MVREMTDTEEAIVDNNRHQCDECGSRDIEEDITRGERVCNGCGLVIDDDIIDPQAEWRMFGQESSDTKSRAGAPTSLMLHDKGLSTDIDWQNKDYAGKSVNINRSQLYRMRKWQKRSRVSNASERNLSVALAEIERMSSHLSLPKAIREEAALIYRKANEKRLCRGRSIEAVVSASVYLACRLSGLPRTLDEVSDKARAGRKEIGRTSRMMVKTMSIRVYAPRPKDFTSRFCSMLGLSPEVEALAAEYIQRLSDTEMDNGRGPVGLCGASIYIASVKLDQRRTQKEVALISGVTEVTIRNRYKEIIKVLGLDVTI